MKVLFVTNLWPDDARPWHGTFVRTQAGSLERAGVDLDVMAIRGYAGRGAYATGARRTLALNRTGRYDVVHAHYGHSAVLARLQLRAPLVISYCGDDLLGTPDGNGGVTARSRVEAGVFKQLSWVADATITKSAEMESMLPAARIARNHVIPNGVDLERFRPIDRDEARDRLGWSRDERVALFVGNPEIKRKNHPLAAEVVDLVRRDVPEMRLRVAWGIGPDDMPLWMSAADLLLFTSITEGSPNTVKEAMAAELPIVSVPVGDTEERLRGVAGCYVRPPEVQALADAVRTALEHQGRAPAARAAVEPLGLDAVAQRVIDVYREVQRGPSASVRS
jgi:teichuronic acid biosynthesis glycosyltransferase TuaC